MNFKKITLLLIALLTINELIAQNQKTEIFGINHIQNTLQGTTSDGTNNHLEAFALIPLHQSVKNTIGTKIIYSRSQFSGLTEGFNHTLSTVDLNAFWQRQINENDKVQLAIMYGAFSDFKDLSADDFRLRAAANYTHKYNDELSLGGGLMYSRHFNSNMFIPFASLNYKVTDRLTLAGLYPIKPKVIFQIKNNTRWVTEGVGHAETYRLSKKDLKNSVLEMTGWTLMTGLDYTIKNHHRFSAGVGYTLSQRLRYYEDPSSMKLKLWNFDLSEKETPILDEKFKGLRWMVGYNFVF